MDFNQCQDGKNQVNSEASTDAARYNFCRPRRCVDSVLRRWGWGNKVHLWGIMGDGCDKK